MPCNACPGLSPEDSLYCCWCGQRLDEKPRKSGLAIASLFLGLLGLAAVSMDWLDAPPLRVDLSGSYFPAMVLGILFGHLALRRIAKDHTRFSGRGMARIGLMVGYATLIVGLAVLYVPQQIQDSKRQKELPAWDFLETVNGAAFKVREAQPDRGYPRNFEELDLNPNEYERFSLTLARGSATGYTFTYTPVNTDAGLVAGYRVVALPRAGSGLHKFSSDQTRTIRQEEEH